MYMYMYDDAPVAGAGRIKDILRAGDDAYMSLVSHARCRTAVPHWLKSTDAPIAIRVRVTATPALYPVVQRL